VRDVLRADGLAAKVGELDRMVTLHELVAPPVASAAQ
jgi:hypothetical protein